MMCVWGWRAHDVCLGMGFANTPRPGPGVSDLLVDDWAGVAVKAAPLTPGRLGLLFLLPFAREGYELIVSKHLIPIFL